jgi:hypothetical protein
MRSFAGDVNVWKLVVDSTADYGASSPKCRAVSRPGMLVRREKDEASALVVASTAVIRGCSLALVS